ncbi:hypothetical protein C8R31_102235 [Nitrosospira sp. Nsp2]|uniref:endonuclease/exonuclease/phosphatase family protein n=1 Tax=Nitrosospira sp. Nsp2 TaxID=136548 RepID=UPI000D41D37F|nr:hypothetical protein [Nitrosospira sp. Nsp2]PTR16221.1 hypothetical protein C8R31_102235 [Nitrosospira sp. Nsp2]
MSILFTGKWRLLGDSGPFRREDRHTGRTGFRINRQAKGRSSWSGLILSRFEDFSDQQRMNTALVVNFVNADIFCAIEVEGMEVLRVFNRSVAATSYGEYIAIDSPNDPRGIDIGCLTRYHMTNLITHVFNLVPGTNRRVFSRHCLELAIDRDENTRIHVLCNHFKSQMGAAEESAAKRLEQARAVASTVDRYDLARQYAVVMGDMNEDTSSAFGSLHPLLQKNGLHPSSTRLYRSTALYPLLRGCRSRAAEIDSAGLYLRIRSASAEDYGLWF